MNTPEALKWIASLERHDSCWWSENAPRLPRFGGKYVYFAVAGNGVAVKIGMTNSLWNRMEALERENPFDCWYMRVIPFSRFEVRNAERWLHKRYKPLRIKGEWFRPCEDMLTVMPRCEYLRPAFRTRKEHGTPLTVIAS